jgi:hypothetical protein
MSKPSDVVAAGELYVHVRVMEVAEKLRMSAEPSATVCPPPIRSSIPGSPRSGSDCPPVTASRCWPV